MKKRRFKTLLISAGCLSSVVSHAETTITIEKKKNDAFYSPFGKRDPFRIPTVGGLGEDASVGPLQRFHVDQFKLRAIMRGIGEPKAMFQDPRGRSHIVSQGDLIGIEKATVSRIIKSEVILTERTYNYLGKESLLERVIALPQDTELDPLQLVGEGKIPEAKRNAASESEAEEQERSSNTPAAKGTPSPATAADSGEFSESVSVAPATVKKDPASVPGSNAAPAAGTPAASPTNPAPPVTGINEGVPQSTNSAAVPSREVVSTSPVPEPSAPVPVTGAPVPVANPPSAVPTPTP